VQLPESLDDYVADTNPVRVVDVFVDELDLGQLGFEGVVPAKRPQGSSSPLARGWTREYCTSERELANHQQCCAESTVANRSFFAIN